MGKRMKMLGKRRGMVIVTLAVVLLAVGAWIGSGANFAVNSAPSVGNTFTAGELVPTDSGATLDAHYLSPGNELLAGTMGVTNDGNIDGQFYISCSSVTANALGDSLSVRVIGFDGSTEIYTGLLKDMDMVSCGTLTPTSTGQITVYASFPDTDAGLGTYGSDNALMNMVATASLTWTAVSL